MTCFPNQIGRLLILLLDAIVSKLLDAYDEHVKLFECGDCMRHILLGTVQLSNLDAAVLNDVLRLSGILPDCLNLFNEDERLVVDRLKLLSSLLLSVSLLLYAILHFLVQLYELAIIVLYLALNILKRCLIGVLVIEELDNVEVWRQHRIVE